MKKELLTVEVVHSIERSAIARGVSEEFLREQAGQGVVEVILKKFSPCFVVIFCGPGKNGEDGKIVGYILKKKGWPVEIINFDELSLDHKIENLLNKADIIVDALFGTGLTRPLEDETLNIVHKINGTLKPVVSIDIPTGIESNSGSCLSESIHATYTVTFFRARIGHYLLPGRTLRGNLFIKELGISDAFFPKIKIHLNIPDLWNHFIKDPQPFDNKYDRGPCLIIANGCMPGAIRLASLAARRIGAGLVRIMCKHNEYSLFANTVWGEIITPIKSADDFLNWVENKHFKALLWGPGASPNESTRKQAILLMSVKKPCVLDGGALSSFTGKMLELTNYMHENVILTPHEGEFSRLFPHLAFLRNKTEKALKAAEEIGAIVVLKGYDTVIASPQGDLIINANAPTILSTAGTGDILAGLMVSLLAQGVPAFQAAAAAVWMQGAAASRKGLGFIAEDLLDEFPPVLQYLSKCR